MPHRVTVTLTDDWHTYLQQRAASEQRTLANLIIALVAAGANAGQQGTAAGITQPAISQRRQASESARSVPVASFVPHTVQQVGAVNPVQQAPHSVPDAQSVEDMVPAFLRRPAGFVDTEEVTPEKLLPLWLTHPSWRQAETPPENIRIYENHPQDGRTCWIDNATQTWGYVP